MSGIQRARIAEEAERLGYASLWTYERLLRPLAEVRLPGGGWSHDTRGH